MKKLNYVIATYNGFCKRTHKYPNPENILREHLNKILELKNNISQITIMVAESSNYYKNYYDIDDIVKMSNIDIKIVNCVNYGYSLGQWLKAYELFYNEFEYFLFIEDDYCAGMDNFDSLLIDIYNKKFPYKIGLLCSLVQGSENYHYKGLPIHFEGFVLLSVYTLQKMYYFWKNSPRYFLDKIDNSNDYKKNSNFSWNKLKNLYLGAYYQISFSHLFTRAGIKHEDYLDIDYNNKKFQFPYWSDINNSIGGRIFFYEKYEKIKNNYTIDNIYNSPIIPIQLSNLENIKQNTNLNIVL